MSSRNRLMIISIAVVLLVGCAAPTQEVKQFGAATAAVATDAKGGYVFFNQTIKRKQLEEAVEHPERPVTAKTWQSFLDEQNIIASRTKLLSALSGYATSIQQLADKDFKKDIDASSKDLVSALSSLKADFENISGSKLAVTKSEIGILATVVDGLGSGYVDWKRKQALRTIVAKADPGIQQVAALLKKEFDHVGPATAIILNRIQTDMTKNYNNKAPKKSEDWRRAQLEKLQASADDGANAQNLFKSIGEAAQKMGKAHASLKVALQQDKWTTTQFSADVRELRDRAEAVKDFYNSLQK